MTLKAIRAWTGTNGHVRRLVLAFSASAARAIAGVSRAEFDGYWMERRVPAAPLSWNRLYERPVSAFDDLAWQLIPERTPTMASTKPTKKRSKQIMPTGIVPPTGRDRELGKYERAAKGAVYVLTTTSLASSSVIDAAVDYIAECGRVAATPATEAKARLKLGAAVERLEGLHDLMGTFDEANARTIERVKRHGSRRS